MMTNRVLRFVQRPVGVFHSSVFFQFSGRMGPSAVCCDSDGNVYVARYDFAGSYPHDCTGLRLLQEGTRRRVWSAVFVALHSDFRQLQSQSHSVFIGSVTVAPLLVCRGFIEWSGNRSERRGSGGTGH